MRNRLRQYIKEKGISEYRFLKDSNLSLSFFTSSLDGLSARTLGKIGASFPDLNISWVMSGEGEMIRTTEETIPMAEHLLALQKKDEEIKRLKKMLDKVSAKAK